MVNATKSQNIAGLPESIHNQESKEFQAVNNQTVNNFLEDWEKSLRPIQVWVLHENVSVINYL